MIGNPVLGCGLRRIHFALPDEYRKYKKRRMDKLEEQPAYDVDIGLVEKSFQHTCL
jgi:hypothetical protein